MSSPEEPEVHHYPPTTADWVTSPLQDHDQLEHNPLEPAHPTVKPAARLGALLILAGGLLALGGLFLEFWLITHPAAWYVALVTVPMVVAALVAVGGMIAGRVLLFTTTRRDTVDVMRFAVSGFALQLIDGFFLLAVGAHRSSTLELGYGLSVASFLLMLICGCLVRIIGKPAVTEQDIADAARKRELLNTWRNGANLGLKAWRGPWGH